MMIEWAAPLFLWLFIPLAAAVVLAWRRLPPTLMMGSIKQIDGVPPSRSVDRIPIICFALAGVFLVIALARPQRRLGPTRRRASGIDIMICVDVSKSMQLVDIPGAEKMRPMKVLEELRSGKHKPRLDVAKEEIRNFVTRRQNDRIGLVAFSGVASTLCPPTLDHDFLIEQVMQLDIGIADDTSTSIGPPIANATIRLRDSKARRRVIILLTDGEDSGRSPVRPEAAARAAKLFNITIHTIGVGSKAAIMRGMPSQHFNPTLIKEIASLTGGRYWAAKDAAGMKAVMKQIDELEKTTATEKKQYEYADLFIPMSVLGLASLLLGFILSNTVLLRIP